VRVHYLDASAWVKRHSEERGTRVVCELFASKEPLIISSLAHLEVSATVARRAHARLIDSRQYALLTGRIDQERTQSLFIEILPEHVRDAVGLAREFGLTGADALHLAIAWSLKKEFARRGDELIFWTSDGNLLRAAPKIPVSTINPAESEQAGNGPSTTPAA
jgi:predicted nucleic acid-binding protein